MFTKFLVVLFALFAFQTVSAAYYGTSLDSNSANRLYANDWMASADGSMFFYVQNDGNLCIYRGTPLLNLGYVNCNRGTSLPLGRYWIEMYGSGIMGQALGDTAIWSCSYTWTTLPSDFYFFINKTSATTANMVIKASNSDTLQICF